MFLGSRIRRSVLALLVSATASLALAQTSRSERQVFGVPSGGGRTAVTGASDGSFYSTGDGLRNVYRFGSDGSPAGSFGGFGTGVGQLGAPIALAIGAGGDVFVGDLSYENYPAQQFSSDGTFLRSFGLQSQGQTNDLALAPSEILLLKAGSGNVERFSTSGASIGSFPTGLGGQSASIAASQITGDVYVMGASSHQIRQYTSTGSLIRTWNVPAGDGVSIWGLVVAADGSIYAGARSAVFRYGPAGEQLGSYVEAGETLDVYVSGSYLFSAKGSTVSRVEIGVPLVTLASAPSDPGPGQTVALTASASVPFGSVAGYEWDLDGDGTFETTGQGASTSRTYASAGDFPYSVRVTSGSGTSAVASGTVAVRGPLTPGPDQPGEGPSNGPIGVSINNGAQYTNDPRVDLRLSWPSGISEVLLSNDGGFRQAQSFSPRGTLPWLLQSSGPERLPKTVYVRFGSSTQNYTDDIILDETAPEISSATLVDGGPVTRSRSYLIKVKASDRTSGLARAQAAANKKRPLRIQKFARSLSVKGARPNWIRVRDGAGNWSKWRKVR